MAWTSEAELESFFLDELAALGFARHHGSEISPEAKTAMRASYHETILAPVFDAALARLNPGLPDTALKEAGRRIKDAVFTTDVIQENRRVHDLMVNGIAITYFSDGEERNARIQLVD